jgi:hypothetical protein
VFNIDRWKSAISTWPVPIRRKPSVLNRRVQINSPETGSLEISHEEGKVRLRFKLEMETRRDEELEAWAKTERYLARFRAFHECTGRGKSVQSAEKSLRSLFKDYIQVYAETWGYPALERDLERRFSASDEKSEGWRRFKSIEIEMPVVA